MAVLLYGMTSFLRLRERAGVSTSVNPSSLLETVPSTVADGAWSSAGYAQSLDESDESETIDGVLPFLAFPLKTKSHSLKELAAGPEKGGE